MGRNQDQALAERNQRMASMYRQGLTLDRIGKEHGVTRERVRMILRTLGVDAGDGGQKKRSAMKKAAAAQRQEAKCMLLFGVGLDEYKHLRSIGAVRAWKSQKKNAAMRGIEFKLSLVEWWTIWRDSGKFDQRGRARNSYVMSRICDAGSYEIGNVQIKTLAENSREAVNVWRGKAKTLPRGVFENLPGYSKPFLAKVGKVSLGYFATAQEADAARKAYCKEAGVVAHGGLGRGRGWTFVKRLKARPYLSQIAGMKDAFFATQQEAEAYYAVTTARLNAERLAA